VTRGLDLRGRSRKRDALGALVDPPIGNARRSRLRRALGISSSEGTETNMSSVNDKRKPATETMLDAALALADGGFGVFPLWGIAAPAPAEIVATYLAGPKTKEAKKAAQAHARCCCGDADCRSPGKHPIGALAPNGVQNATTDAATIERWFKAHPTANIGICMPPGVAALDDDRIEGAAERAAELPPTLTQTSGLGSHRIYTGAPEDFAFGSTLDGVPGIDIIHAGHRYLVAAPSMHWTGRRYAWVDFAVEAVTIPDDLLARCARGTRPAKARTSAATPDTGPGRFGTFKGRREAFAEHCPAGVDPKAWARVLAVEMAPAISDDEPESTEHGHVTLLRAAGSLIAGLQLPEAYALEVLWTHYNPRCVPPWADDERADFERTVRGAGAGLDPGYLLPKGAEPFYPAAGSDGELDGLVFGTLSGNPPRQTFLVPELEIGVGRPYGWVGKTNASKTLALMQLEVDLALGRPVFGQFAGPGKPVPVLRLAYEGFAKAPEDYLRLLRGTGAALDFAELNGRLRFAEGRRHFGVNDDTREWLLRITEPFGGGVCVIDPLVAACRGLDENSVEIAQPIYDLESVSKTNGVAFIVAHHFGHGAERSRGSSAIDGAFGASASIAKVDGNREHHRLVQCVKRNRFGFQAFELVIRDTTEQGKPWRPTVDAIRANETSWAVRVETTLRTAPDPKEAEAARALAEKVAALEAVVRDSVGGISARAVRTALGLSGERFPGVLDEAKRRGHVWQRPEYGRNASTAVVLEWLEVAAPPQPRRLGKFDRVK